jgi:hypothetical protein
MFKNYKEVEKRRIFLKNFGCTVQYVKIIHILRRRHALKKLQAASSSFARDRHVPWQVVIAMGKETLPSHLTIAKSYPNTTEIAKCTDVSSQYSAEF